MAKKYDVTALLVIGLIAERPRHAYEVETCIKERNFRQWTAIGFSSIYALLNRLERDGLLESTREAVGARPARRTYSVTESGRERTREGVAALLAEPTVHRSAICVALALSAASPPGDLVAPLEQLAKTAEEALASLAEREQAARAHWWTPVIAAIFDHDRALIEAEAAWATRTARALADGDAESPSWSDWDS